MREAFEVTSIKIGNDQIVSDTKIEQHVDGSMLLSDPYVPGVKLSDLVDGSSVIISPGVLVEIDVGDWIESIISGQKFYSANIVTNWEVSKPLVNVVVYDSNDIMVTVEKIKIHENYISIRTTTKEKLKVALKKL